MKVGLLIFSVMFPNLCVGKYLLVQTEDDDSEPGKKIANEEPLVLEKDYHDVDNKEDNVLDSRGPFNQVQNRAYKFPCVFICFG